MADVVRTAALVGTSGKLIGEFNVVRYSDVRIYFSPENDPGPDLLFQFFKRDSASFWTRVTPGNCGIGLDDNGRYIWCHINPGRYKVVVS
jgi:hypothetical protein